MIDLPPAPPPAQDLAAMRRSRRRPAGTGQPRDGLTNSSEQPAGDKGLAGP